MFTRQLHTFTATQKHTKTLCNSLCCIVIGIKSHRGGCRPIIWQQVFFLSPAALQYHATLALHHFHLNGCKIRHDPKRNHVLAQTQAPHALYRVTWSKRDREEVESPGIVVEKNECKSETLGIGTPRLSWLNFEGERAKVIQNYNNIWHLLRRACAACRGAKSCFLGWRTTYLRAT